MSYEYKALIEQAIIDDDRPLDWEEGFKELDEVYAQAAKADEYEAKAKAFDVIKEYITDELREMRRVTEDVPFAFAEELEALEDVLDKMTEYESGEYDAKK